MDFKKIIDEEGVYECLICKFPVKWFYKFHLINECDLDTFVEALTRAIEMKLYNRIAFSTLNNGNIEFSISCPTCEQVHKIEKSSWEISN